MALTSAAGGRCISDVAVLRDQPRLFGQVASDATVWRVFDAIDEPTLEQVRAARAQATAGLVGRLEVGELILDVDASLFEDHSEHKEGAAPHFKGGFGFHPMLVFAELGEARFPFTRFLANAAWLQLMLVAALLLAATRRLLLDGELAVAEPRRLRHTLLHAAARITRRSRQTWLKLPDNWPWTGQLLAAYQRLAGLAPAPG